MTSQDLPAAWRLSTQAGWNQLEQDWLRLIHLWPQSCLAGWERDQLIATGTLASFGPSVAWVGMILVDQACRGRGLGGLMFRAITGLQTTLKIEQLGLDATDMGRPVYLKQGFVDHAPIARWIGPTAELSDKTPTRLLAPKDWPALLRLDAQAVGADRSGLLERLAGEPAAAVRVLDGPEGLAAFGFSRPGRMAGYLGPVVADSTDRAIRVMDALRADRRTHDGPGQVLIDIPAPGHPIEDLQKREFTRQRRLMRMVRPMRGPQVLDGPLVFATAGLELG